GATTFQYDPQTDDLLKVNYPGDRFLAFTYDFAGRRTQSVDQTGFTVKYIYGATGLLTGLQDGAGIPIVTYTYDAMGLLQRKLLANGTSTSYAFDQAGNLLHLINFAPNGSVNSRFDYTYDSLNRRTSETTMDGTWVYQYGPSGGVAHALF